jgi:hypothetical protein
MILNTASAHSNWAIHRNIDRFASTKTNLLVYSAVQYYGELSQKNTHRSLGSEKVTQNFI